jgi:hypothetical protein
MTPAILVCLFIVVAVVVAARFAATRGPEPTPKRRPSRPARDSRDPRPHGLGNAWLAVAASPEDVAAALGGVARFAPLHEVIDDAFQHQTTVVVPSGTWSIVVGLAAERWDAASLARLSAEVGEDAWAFVAVDPVFAFALARDGAVVRERFVDHSDPRQDRLVGAPLEGETDLQQVGLDEEMFVEWAEMRTAPAAALLSTEVVVTRTGTPA